MRTLRIIPVPPLKALILRNPANTSIIFIEIIFNLQNPCLQVAISVAKVDIYHNFKNGDLALVKNKPL